MLSFRPVFLLVAVALLHVAYADDDIDCHTCETSDKACPGSGKGKTAKCPNSKYCMVDVAFADKAVNLPGTTVNDNQPKPDTMKPGQDKPKTYYRQCGPNNTNPQDLNPPTGYKKEGDLMCLQKNKFKKVCFCTKDDCNKKNPTLKQPNSGAVNNVAKLAMVVMVGVLAAVM